MHGQGSPHTTHSRPSPVARHRTRNTSRSLQVAVWLCALIGGIAPLASAEDLSLRLWIAWQGRAACQWKGRIRIEDGSLGSSPRSPILEFRPVGLTPDEPGSMYVDGNTLYIDSRSPRTYDGVSLLVNAASDARLSIELTPLDRPQAAKSEVFDLREFVSQVHNPERPDEWGDRLLVRRTPGDRLRVRHDRTSLVFSPGDEFNLNVDPHLVSDIEPNTKLIYTVELRRVLTDDELGRVRTDDEFRGKTREVRSDENGDPPEVGFTINLPQIQGVYDVVISLKQRIAPLGLRTRLAPAKTIHERSLQLVVIDSNPPIADMSAWEVIEEITPSVDQGTSQSEDLKSTLAKWLDKLPNLPLIPGSDSGDKLERMGNGRSRKQVHPDHEFIELLPEGWQAYQLPVKETGIPHVLDLAYPNDFVQTLGIYIVEPDAADVVRPLGPHSGLDIPATSSVTPPQIELHRVVFWPRSTTPLLLLANLRQDTSAVFGQIRVLAGPTTLPVRKVARGEDLRLLAAYLDRPLFPENFSASDAVDPVTGRNLNDWLTFLDGGSRLVQYSKYVGYNGAMVSVLRDGAAIYPSGLLESTPRYDNGIFFGTAQDPQQKDVLEMLFRLFDREGLRLVPALSLSTPLPELETLLRRQDKTTRNSIELTDAGGRTWRQVHGAGRASGPYYNPLDPQVQQAIRRVVAELVERYGNHPSFAGVAIQLGPNTYAQLPDIDWAQDAITVDRFARDERIVIPGVATGDREQQAMYLRAEGRDRWLNWRATKLAEFYKTVQNDLATRSRVPGARLYLAGADMLNGQDIQNALQPKLPLRLDVHRAMLRVGIDPTRYADNSGIVLLRPYRCAPLASLGEQAVNLEMRQSEAMDELFAEANDGSARASVSRRRQATGALFYHEPQSLTISSFGQNRSFGSEAGSSWFTAHVSPAGLHNRRRFVHGLAALDSQVMFDGGWMTLLGQQESMFDLIEVYSRLPVGRFETVHPKDPEIEAQPIVVRKLTAGNETYVYVANDSPWPISIALDFEVARPFNMQHLSSRDLPDPVLRGNHLSWRIRLDPYDLIGTKFSTADVEVVDWRVELSQEVFDELKSRIADILWRARELKQPKPLAVLANPGFDLPKQQNLIPGWTHAKGNGVSIDLDPTISHDGQNSLRVSSTGPVAWVRSNPFPAPKTGRLSVWMWLRIRNVNEQPPLQLAVEGRLNGEPYYRPAPVGANDGRWRIPPTPLPDRWQKPYLVRVDDLPTSGLTDLRVAVDLMGKGEVWVDDIQVFDLWFDETEINQLITRSGLAKWQLNKGEVVKCERFVRSYWAEFLRRHVKSQAPQMAEIQEPGNRYQPQPPTNDTPGTDQQDEPKSWLKKITPKLPFWR